MNRRTSLLLSSRISPRETWAGVTLGLALTGWVIGVEAGWGWDSDHPLRPWPWVSVVRAPKWAKSRLNDAVAAVSFCGLTLRIGSARARRAP